MEVIFAAEESDKSGSKIIINKLTKPGREVS